MEIITLGPVKHTISSAKRPIKLPQSGVLLLIIIQTLSWKENEERARDLLLIWT